MNILIRSNNIINNNLEDKSKGRSIFSKKEFPVGFLASPYLILFNIRHYYTYILDKFSVKEKEKHRKKRGCCVPVNKPL